MENQNPSDPNQLPLLDLDNVEQTTPDPATKEKPKAKLIPKQNTKEEIKREQTIENVQSPTAPTKGEEIENTYQLTIDEAIAEAMTKANPMSHVKGLAKAHKLREVTATYKALEDLGHH